MFIVFYFFTKYEQTQELTLKYTFSAAYALVKDYLTSYTCQQRFDLQKYILNFWS